MLLLSKVKLKDLLFYLLDTLLSLSVLMFALASFLKHSGSHHWPNQLEQLVGGDKIMHVIAGFCLLLFCFRFLSYLPVNLLKNSIVKPIILASFISTLVFSLDEYLQIFNNQRTAGWPDC